MVVTLSAIFIGINWELRWVQEAFVHLLSRHRDASSAESFGSMADRWIVVTLFRIYWREHFHCCVLTWSWVINYVRTDCSAPAAGAVRHP